MKTVWLLRSTYCDDVLGVFSTRELGERFVEARYGDSPDHRAELFLEEAELDPQA